MTEKHVPRPETSPLTKGGWADEEEDYSGYEYRLDSIEPKRMAIRRSRLAFRDSAEGRHGRVEGEMADGEAPAGLTMSYRPARFEQGWLAASLRSFYDLELIVDVLAQVKGGKEANVYRCQAHPKVGTGLLAAKVYRPRKFRNLSNDIMYREGRPILTGSGQPVRSTDNRIIRAIGKKTPFGVEVLHTSWLMYEYTTLERLHRAGAAVPQPYAANENAILMGYSGDASRAAPTLNEVSLGRREAHALFAEVLRNVDVLLQHGLIHGDLSAYNILYWQKKITLIDFPQVTSLYANHNARAILERDVRRVCEYFARQGVRSDPASVVEEMWDRYGETDLGWVEVAD